MPGPLKILAPGSSHRNLPRMTRLLLAAAIVSLAAPLSAQAPARPAIPAELFAAPGGPYSVGTREYHWIDQARPEIWTKDQADRRHVLVRAWHPAPAPAAGAEKAAWIMPTCE